MGRQGRLRGLDFSGWMGLGVEATLL